MADDQPPVSDSTPPQPAESAASEVTPTEPAAEAPATAEDAAQAPPAESAEAVAATQGAEPSIDELLQQASFEDVAGGDVPPPVEAVAQPTTPFELANLQQVMQDAQASSIELLRDVELNVKIELGRSRMLVEDVLKLTEGSVVELDKLAGDPVDVFVNDRLVARGEVLVLNDNFCVRVNEIVAGMKDEGL
jgi:flagellar motor switch protein FliN/FliY